MKFRDITPDQKEIYNTVVNHPLQSYEWGEFRKNCGIKVIRRGLFDKDTLIAGFTLTIHPIPHTHLTIGYLPKGNLPDRQLIQELQTIGRQELCVFIQLEPNITTNQEPEIRNQSRENRKLEIGDWRLPPAAHPLFTRHTFILDLAKSEPEILAGMHHKTRYNIKVAKKHGVLVLQDNSKEAFERYWHLMQETTKRQNFYAHTKRYHELQWEIFPHDIKNFQEHSRKALKKSRITNAGISVSVSPKTYHMSATSKNAYPESASDFNNLTSHLFIAQYTAPGFADRRPQTASLTTMLFFVFHDTLYYPYGASSDMHRNLMHSTLTMWEAIRFGKALGLKKFDMWGALGSNPDPRDPWFGFHEFKRKFGPEHIEFIGSYDLIIHPLLYRVYKIADRLRWLFLRIKKVAGQ